MISKAPCRRRMVSAIGLPRRDELDEPLARQQHDVTVAEPHVSASPPCRCARSWCRGLPRLSGGGPRRRSRRPPCVGDHRRVPGARARPWRVDFRLEAVLVMLAASRTTVLAAGDASIGLALNSRGMSGAGRRDCLLDE